MTTFGTVSHGTMLCADLAPVFADLLEELAKDEIGSYSTLIAEARTITGESPLNNDIVNDLFDALNEFAPAYGYFGAHPGDGSDYGFWLSEDFMQDMKDNEVQIVDDASEIAGDGEFAIVTDHGNVTFGYRKDGADHVVWSVV